MEKHVAERKVAKALERRFGASTMPIRFSWNPKGGLVRAIDAETGSYVEADCSGWRIRIIDERDAA
jgi:hypothetical protein